MIRWLRFAFKFLLTLGVMVAVVVAVDPVDLLDALRQARWPWLMAAILLLPLNLLLDGWVWAQLLDTVEGSFSPRKVGEAVLSGLALGFWTPARLGEYAGRAFAFPEANRWTLSLTVFVQRMVDMAVGVLMGLGALAGALWGGVLPSSSPWVLAGCIGLGTGGALTVVLLRPAWIHRWLRWLVPSRSIADRAALLRRIDGRQKVTVGAGSLARYLVFTGQFVCLSRALQPSASLGGLAMAVGLVFYAKYLFPSLTLLDLGIREGAAALFFPLFGLDAAVGLSAALLLFTLNVLGPALLGLPFVARLPVPLPSDGLPTRLRSVLPGS